MTVTGGQGRDAPTPLGRAPHDAESPRRPRIPVPLVLVALAAVAVAVVVVVLMPVGPREDADAPLALTTEVLTAVQARDAEALDALLVDDPDLPWVRADAVTHQPSATDLVVCDEGLAEALDLEVTWTPPERDTSIAGSDAGEVVQQVRTTVTYAYDVDGTRYTSSDDVLFSWSGWEDGRRTPWRLEYVVVPDTDGSTSTFDPAPVTGEVTEPGAAAFGVGVCTANWIAMTQALGVYGGPDAFDCFPDGRVPAAVDPAVAAEVAKPAAQRRFEFDAVQTQLTGIGWSETLPLSEWVVSLDDREYLVAVARVADGSGRVVAAVPAG